MNHYLANSVVCFVNIYSPERDLPGGWCYPAFEEPGPGVLSLRLHDVNPPITAHCKFKSQSRDFKMANQFCSLQ